MLCMRVTTNTEVKIYLPLHNTQATWGVGGHPLVYWDIQGVMVPLQHQPFLLILGHREGAVQDDVGDSADLHHGGDRERLQGDQGDTWYILVVR